MPDEALGLHVLDHPELILERDERIDSVQLPKVDALKAQPPQRHVHALAQVLRASDRAPLIGALAREAAFRCDEEPLIRIEGLADEVLAHLRAIRVGGVDEIDAEFNRSTQDLDGSAAICRIAPDAGPGDAHGSKAKAPDGHRVGR